MLYRNNGDGTFTDVSEQSAYFAIHMAKVWDLHLPIMMTMG